jgi:hypothetical protein
MQHLPTSKPVTPASATPGASVSGTGGCGHGSRRARAAAATAALTALVTCTAAPALASTATRPEVARAKTISGADAAAGWLARQFDGHSSIPGAKGDPPDYSDTAQAVLALAVTGTQTHTVASAMTYLRDHVADEITTTYDGRTVGDPGAIAFLILDAHATGGSARDFGGVNLVDKLLATGRTSGQDAGLFGAIAPTYDGAYRQGLSLAALAGVSTSAAHLAPAVAWLQHQQCSSGGWESYRADVKVACTARDPKTYSGPDTNSTALAVEGMVAAGGTFRTAPFAFLLDAQDTDGGWGYYGGPSDPDSTAVVIQALVSLKRAHDPHLSRSGGTPQSSLRAKQITSGTDAGAFFYPGTGAPTGNLLATEQAIPALDDRAFPLAPPASPDRGA